MAVTGLYADRPFRLVVGCCSSGVELIVIAVLLKIYFAHDVVDGVGALGSAKKQLVGLALFVYGSCDGLVGSDSYVGRSIEVLAIGKV